jgi:hypothetical protein
VQGFLGGEQIPVDPAGQHAALLQMHDVGAEPQHPQVRQLTRRSLSFVMAAREISGTDTDPRLVIRQPTLVVGGPV